MRQDEAIKKKSNSELRACRMHAEHGNKCNRVLYRIVPYRTAILAPTCLLLLDLEVRCNIIFDVITVLYVIFHDNWGTHGPLL